MTDKRKPNTEETRLIESKTEADQDITKVERPTRNPPPVDEKCQIEVGSIAGPPSPVQPGLQSHYCLTHLRWFIADGKPKRCPVAIEKTERGKS